MKFSIKEYKSALFKMPLISLIIGLLLLVISVLSILNLYNFPDIKIISKKLMIFILVIISFVFLLSSGFKLYFGILLILDKNNIKYVEGPIQRIIKLPFSPRYYYNSKVTRAIMISINCKKYYLMSDSMLYIGKIIRIHYYSKSKITIEWEDYNE